MTGSGAPGEVRPGLMAWEFAQRISPRAHVQVAATMADGTVAPRNAYPRRVNIAGPDPLAPFVISLADDEGSFHLIGFDFDAHHSPASDAQRDAFALVALLERLGDVPYVVCESGPSGGMHVWLAAAEAIPAPVVSTLARAAARSYPTLGIEPLLNPATGGMRPPGSPHRHGGHSTILYGDVDTLLYPTTTLAGLQALTDALDEAHPAAPAAEGLALVDRRGRLYLPGHRTSLGAAATTALNTSPTPDVDASAVLFSVLLGAARARWRYDDVHTLLNTAPGLEHARTERAGRTRRPRPPATQHRVLAHQWDRAVRHAAATHLERRTGANPELTERAAVSTTVVELALQRMRACPGRFATHATPDVPARVAHQRAIDRLVLLELYRRATDAISIEIRASVRTLAMSLPIGRESVRCALHRLTVDGWIRQTAAPEGPHATTWNIDPTGDFHREALRTRSAAGLSPAGASNNQVTWAKRASTLATVRTITQAAAHDCFLPRALGPQAGYLFGYLHAYGSASVDELAGGSGCDPGEVGATLARLASVGLCGERDGQWNAAPLDARDRAAVLLGTSGERAEREHRYRLEQATWSYWQAELEATGRAAALAGAHHRTVVLPGGTPVHLAPYPRRRGNDGAWRRARDRIAHVQAA